MALTKVTYSMINGGPVNVLDYGADLTGAVDSTNAIQQAIDTGRPVLLPAGTYLITTLDLKNKSTSLIGEGTNKTILKASSASVMIDAQDVADRVNLPFLIYGIQLDGNSIATAGIKVRYRHKTTIDTVWITDINGDCLNELDSWNNERNNLTLYNSTNGLVLQGANNNCAYNGLSVSSNSVYQIKIENGGTVPGGSTALSFNQCDVEYASGDGIYVNVTGSTGVISFNDCYLGEEIDGKVFDIYSGEVVVNGGFAWFGKNLTSYLGYLTGGKLFFNAVRITGGANASVSNMFFSGNGRAIVNDSPCYLVVTNAQVMPGDVLSYGKLYETFAPKLGRLYTPNCYNGTYTYVTGDKDITVTCTGSTGSPTNIEVKANIVPNWTTGNGGSLIVVYQSSKDCTVRLTSGTLGVLPAINITGTLPATTTPKTAVFYNWSYTSGVYPTIIEIFQNASVSGDTLTVSEVFLSDVRYTQPDSSATFFNLGKC